MGSLHWGLTQARQQEGNINIRLQNGRNKEEDAGYEG